MTAHDISIYKPCAVYDRAYKAPFCDISTFMTLIEKLKIKPGAVAIINAPKSLLPEFRSFKPSSSIPAGAKPFDSKLTRSGKSFRQQFTVAGNYQYACPPHEQAGMVGKITVTK